MLRFAAQWLIGSWVVGALGCSYEPIALPPSGRAGDAALDGGSEPTTASSDLGPSARLQLTAYSQAATHWNDYVLADDHELPCPRTTPAAECVHAGAWRKLVVPDEQSCQGLTASDRQEWFDWTCSADGGEVVFVARPNPQVGLADMIDEDALAWRTSTAIVERGNTVVAASEPAPLWDNPVLDLPATSGSAITLDEPSAIYVARATPEAALRIAADGVALLGAPEVELRAAASPEAVLAAEPGAFFLWLEGLAVDADGHATGVELPRLVHSAVRDVVVVRDTVLETVSSVDLRIDAEASIVTGLRSVAAAGTAIELLGTRNAISGVDAAGSAGDGLVLRQLTDSVVSDVRVSGAGQNGLRLEGVTSTTLEGISIADCDTNGMLVESDSLDDTFSDLVVTNNGGAGIVLRGSDHRVSLALSASNTTNGVRIEGDHVLLMHTTIANNATVGLQVGGELTGSRADLVNVIVTNNDAGLFLHAQSQGTRVHDAWIAANERGDVAVDGDYNVFTGALALEGEDGCWLAMMNPPVEPGLLAFPCRNTDDSSATISFGNKLQAASGERALAAHQTTSDPLADPVVAGRRAYDAISSWFAFSHRHRHWGRPRGEALNLTPDTFGRCDAASGCAYWDWRVTHHPSSLRDPLAQEPGGRLAALEDAAHVRTHVWSAASAGSCATIDGAEWDGSTAECKTRFVSYAYEPRNDGAGNDNLLCEPGEHCILNRNRGVYPGHGSFSTLDPGPSDGLVELPGFGSITLRMFSENGS